MNVPFHKYTSVLYGVVTVQWTGGVHLCEIVLSEKYQNLVECIVMNLTWKNSSVSVFSKRLSLVWLYKLQSEKNVFKHIRMYARLDRW